MPALGALVRKASFVYVLLYRYPSNDVEPTRKGGKFTGHLPLPSILFPCST